MNVGLRGSPIIGQQRGSRTSPLFQLGAPKSFTETLAQASAKAQGTVAKAQQAVQESLDSMSFAVPRNVPSFTNPQRQGEDVYWGRKADAHASTSGGGLGSSLFGRRQSDLPFYKDKPYHTGSSQSSYGYRRRKRDILLRKRVIGGVLVFIIVLLWYFGFGLPGGSSRGKDEAPLSKIKEGESKGWIPGKKVDWAKRRERVKDAFMLSWNAYQDYAWGFDVFHPIAKQGSQMVPKGIGWIIIDSIDTMMIMGLDKQVQQAREWVKNTLDLDQDQNVNTFETTIRMLGGLLSAHYLSKDDLYLDKASDLADRLLVAYNSPSGIPFASVNLKTGQGIESHADGGASSTAEATSLQLEMKYLAKLTGEKTYWEKAEKVMKVVDDNKMQDGLLPIFIHPRTGHFHGHEIRLGSRGDSYYEYLLKQYLQTKETEPIYAAMYHDAMSGIKKHLVKKSKPTGFTFIAELPAGIGFESSPKMDHLVCFMAGNILLGATNGTTVAEAKKSGKWKAREEEDFALAKELMRTCYETYRMTKTKLGPEIAWFNTDESSKEDITIKPNDAHNLQRPETVESLFIMWRLTKDETYRQWGWEIFQAFMEHSAVDGGSGGFTSLESVLEVPAQQRDNMESFWLAETLKYLYLLFSEDNVLPLTDVVFNTEAHPFPRFDPNPKFKTGWTRLPR